MALLGAACGIVLQPFQPAYGVAFWVWAGGVIAYAVSFPRAQRAFPLPPGPVVAGLIAVLALAGALRFVALAEIPANISIDESLTSLAALRIAQGGAPNVFSSVGWFTMPSLTFAFAAAVMRVAGPDAFFAARLSSAVMGMAGIVCLFVLARRLFGDRVGLVASFLMAASFWHLHNSRTAFPFIQSSFWTAVVLYLQVRARQDRSRAVMAVAGIALGLALQCYFPVRILIVICPLFWFADWYREPVAWRTMVADTATFGVATLLVLAPLLVSVPWNTLAGHSQDVLLTRAGTWQHLAETYQVTGLPAVVWRNVREAGAMFTDWADVCVLNRSPAGLLDVGTLAMLLVGVLVVAWQGGHYGPLVLAWAALTFVLGVALSDAPRASYRLAAAMPALFILAAVGLDRLLFAATPVRHRSARVVRLALICGVASWVLTQNYRLFFVAYANGTGGDTRTGEGRDNADSNARRFMLSHCDGRVFYFVGGWLGPPTDPEPKGLDVFCAQHQALPPGKARERIDRTRPGTFLVLVEDAPLLETLRGCYPSAPVAAQRSRDARLLYWRVDVAMPDLVDGGVCLETAQVR
jgi:4-amino-4-deoxy-L-arabinose transferase-like glycosyltransferase